MKKSKKKVRGTKPAARAPAGQLVLPPWAVLLLFVILGAMLYANTLQVPFVLDDLAIIHFRRYLDQETDAVETRLRVAALLDRQGWPDEAAGEYRMILEAEPNNGEALTRLAAIEKRSR